MGGVGGIMGGVGEKRVSGELKFDFSLMFW
jgi:hypothetical protein